MLVFSLCFHFIWTYLYIKCCRNEETKCELQSHCKGQTKRLSKQSGEIYAITETLTALVPTYKGALHAGHSVFQKSALCGILVTSVFIKHYKELGNF